MAPNCQAIGFGDVVDLIGCDERAGSRNVLDDDIRASKNVFGPEFRKQARIEIVNIARLGADQYRDGLALIKWGLSLNCVAPEKNNGEAY